MVVLLYHAGSDAAWDFRSLSPKTCFHLGSGPEHRTTQLSRLPSVVTNVIIVLTGWTLVGIAPSPLCLLGRPTLPPDSQPDCPLVTFPHSPLVAAPCV